MTYRWSNWASSNCLLSYSLVCSVELYQSDIWLLYCMVLTFEFLSCHCSLVSVKLSCFLIIIEIYNEGMAFSFSKGFQTYTINVIVWHDCPKLPRIVDLCCLLSVKWETECGSASYPLM